MTQVIFRLRGTLDKYIGDAIMAFWGAPLPQPDHPERACRAALEMLQVLAQLQTRWAAQGRPRLDIGIGISTGPTLVGNMGSARRFNYTIMGDNVNLASRLEALNKAYGTRLIIGEKTCQAVRDKMVVRELDLIRVKGKKTPVKIYELLGPLDEAERYRSLIERFEAGLAAYRHAQWETALARFEELRREHGEDEPTRLFIERCRQLLQEPPAGEWDGAFVMKTK
jgi:adenylate cyclase